MIQAPYLPIIKPKGFNPSPVAGNIPLYADSIINPKVIGTKAYEDFWNEQFDRCLNGYDTGGIHIPGRYYFYLNYVILRGLKGPQYPFFVDLDLEYFRLVDWIKENRKTGIISVKARRKGLSEKFEGGIISYGLRFIEGYRGAVTAGIETYVTGLRNKFDSTQSNIIQDLRLNVLQDNDKIFKIGYEKKTPVGGFVEDGYGGFLSFETMYDDFAKLEGEYFHDVLLEESGKYNKVGQVFSSIKPALEFGSQMLGTFFIQGTGGNILSTSKGFKELWDNAETFGLVKFWVPGTRMHYPFYGNPKEDYYLDPDDGSKQDAIPNLRHLSKEQRIGCEDIKAAEEWIIKKRIEYAKLPNKKKLKEHNQSYPLTVEEAWTSGGSNNFNSDKIYDRLFAIEGDPNAYTPVVLEWVTSSDGKPLEGYDLKVKHRPADKNDPDWKIVWVYQYPRADMLDLDIGGIDAYNQDLTQTTSSQGAMVVLRQGGKVNLVSEGIHKGTYPVCLYYKRPPRKEEFYDICLKIAVWYRLKRNTMCSAEQDFVIDYFVKNNGLQYLSPRPKSFDSPRAQQVHKYGAKFTGYSKEMILGIVQTWVENYVDLCNFVEILRDLLAYDEEYIGTDWDAVDALAYAIMRIEDMRTRPRRNDLDDESVNDEPVWGMDENGNMVIKNQLPQNNTKETKQKEEKDSKRNWSELDYDESLFKNRNKN